MNPHSYVHLILDEEKTASSTNIGKSGYLPPEN
jgi:hypothetical protein